MEFIRFKTVIISNNVVCIGPSAFEKMRKLGFIQNPNLSFKDLDKGIYGSIRLRKINLESVNSIEKDVFALKLVQYQKVNAF